MKKLNFFRKPTMERIPLAALAAEVLDDDAKYYRLVSHVLEFAKTALVNPAIFTGLVYPDVPEMKDYTLESLVNQHLREISCGDICVKGKEYTHTSLKESGIRCTITGRYELPTRKTPLCCNIILDVAPFRETGNSAERDIGEMARSQWTEDAIEEAKGNTLYESWILLHQPKTMQNRKFKLMPSNQETIDWLADAGGSAQWLNERVVFLAPDTTEDVMERKDVSTQMGILNSICNPYLTPEDIVAYWDELFK